tara:strand:- start:25 stop:912 length:888 start_codon:yes stop_codon:yes gene_type:complete
LVEKINILITGSKGQLGKSIKDISSVYDHKFFFTDKTELDITNYKNVEFFLKKNLINTIVNCAAYTNVNDAELNKSHCESVNHTAVENIAKLCSELNIQLIHISTDYVFDGNANFAYTENSGLAPINYYGKSKLRGEKKILLHNPKKSVIIRTSWLYSFHGSNFLVKITDKLKKNREIFVVDNEIGSPTNSLDLAKTIIDLIPKLSNQNIEIYHFSNLGLCSRYEFANKINEILKFDCVITPIKQDPSQIKRPAFSAIDSSKIINDFQIFIDKWQISLKKYLKKNNEKSDDRISM